MKSEWNTGTIAEICSLVTDGSHFSPKSCETGELMVSVKDFCGFGFDFTNCKRISKEDYEKLKTAGCVPEIGDILIGKDGARFFEDIIIYNQPEKPALLSSIAILRCNPDIVLPHYLYYICKNPMFKKDVRDNYGSGSAIPRIVLKDFKRMPISYPSIEEQRRIVAALVAIDDKIALNTAINENLEQQAQALFKAWFVGEDDCQPATIAEVSLNVTDGVHNTVKDDLNGDFWLLSCKNIKGGLLSIGQSERRISEETFDKLRKRTQLSKGDILISSVGTIGEILLLNVDPINFEFQRSVAMIKPNTELVSSIYVYESLLYRKKELINAAHGAVQQCLFISDISEFPIDIPSKEKLEKFNEIAMPMFDKITANPKCSAMITMRHVSANCRRCRSSPQSVVPIFLHQSAAKLRSVTTMCIL